MEHTPTPWRACHEGDCPCGQIWSLPADTHVATVRDGSDEELGPPAIPKENRIANAKFIVEAVNNYGTLLSERDELKKEVERLKELKNLLWYFPDCFDSDPDDAIRYLEITNKAIAIEKEIAESLLKK